MSTIIERTGLYSLIVQLLTEVVMIVAYYYAFNIDTNHHINILKELLVAELFVQFVEAAFYIWMVFNISKIKNITVFRYFDWAITTPTMLVTLIFYLIYLRAEESAQQTDIKEYTYVGLFYENYNELTIILLLNWLMLLFGYSSEINLISPVISTFFGFIPFFAMFYLIYYNYAIFTEDGKLIFWYFSSVWALYGVAALMNYNVKNIMYNILDLFAKNFFGLFLSYIIIMQTYAK